MIKSWKKIIQQIYFWYTQIVMKFHAWFQSKYSHHYWSFSIRLRTCKFQFYITVRSERERKKLWLLKLLEMVQIGIWINKMWNLWNHEKNLKTSKIRAVYSPLCLFQFKNTTAIINAIETKFSHPLVSIRRIDGSLWVCNLFIALSKASCRGIFTAQRLQ